MPRLKLRQGVGSFTTILLQFVFIWQLSMRLSMKWKVYYADHWSWVEIKGNKVIKYYK